MRPLRSFLLGTLFGMVLMFPHIAWLVRTPRIVGDVVPDAFYNHKTTEHYVLKNARGKWTLKKDLEIYIMSAQDVNKTYQERYKDKTDVLGFTDFKANTIWCVDDVRVLIHEMRHVFEGEFHR